MTWKRDKPFSQRLGNGWARLRRIVLERDHYVCQCQECKASARVRPGIEVDHVIPRSQGGTSDLSNLQAINVECHKRKTQMELGHRPKVKVGLDGWPER